MLIALLLLIGGQSMVSQERDRSKIADKYKWNLADIYATDAAWKQAKEKLLAELPAVEQYKGTLGGSSKQLLACLDKVNLLGKEFNRLSVYAGMSSDQDTRDSK